MNVDVEPVERSLSDLFGHLSYVEALLEALLELRVFYEDTRNEIATAERLIRLCLGEAREARSAADECEAAARRLERDAATESPEERLVRKVHAVFENERSRRAGPSESADDERAGESISIADRAGPIIQSDPQVQAFIDPPPHTLHHEEGLEAIPD